MAYGFGTGVQAGLGATDYSNYLRGALSGAQMEAQGTAAIGQGIQSALGSIGQGIKKYQENKVLQAEIMGGVEEKINFIVKNKPELIASAPSEAQKILGRLEDGKGVSLKDSAYLNSWADSATKQAKLDIENNAFASAIAFNEDGTAPTGQQAAMKYFAAGGTDKSLLGGLLAFGSNQLNDELLRKRIEGQTRANEQAQQDIESKRQQLALEESQRNAFQAGISAIPQTITETVEEKVPTFLTPDVNISAPTSFLVGTPQQSYEDFMQTGKITPQAPAMAIDMVSKQPTAPAAAPEAPAIKPVPKNIEQYFVLNPETGALLPTQQLNKETNSVKSALNALDAEKKNIKFTLERGLPTNDPYSIGAPEEPTFGASLTAEQVRPFNERIAQIEQRESLLKEELVRLENVRQSAADFRKQLDKKPSVEETASNVIDRSLRFAEEVNLDPVDKNQWLQMKTVIKDIPRNATDGEKIAAFVKAYGEIAPIDSSVYFKMKQLFDTTPVITDLGGGNQLVTTGNQSFLIRADEVKPMSASDRRLNNQEGYAKLLILAKNMGVDQFIAKHPPLYNKLEELHVLYGDRNSFTNSIFPLRQAIAALSEQPATNTATTPTGSSIQLAANEVLKNQPVRR